ncbi:polyadenylate-binding protein-interacting protein 1-like isoform X4 [Anopheles darlingi]|uniref:polyadenylate-binding protein-interacting protein 1-like isoform X4 n=1 Tax=Anopheles darlingi TaxID=43151 RepID=UPI002100343A|nr:polyadenylate-binding protein-interacting protein 1-like isoform X4 [Anopheles darlingi]
MEPASGFWQPREDGYEQIRTPKGCTLRVAAPEFVPKQHQQPQPHQHQHQQQHYSQQMSMGQPKTSALQLRMEQAAAGEPGGGAGGGSYSGGASYDYTGGHLGGHGGGPHNNGPMSNGNDQMKTSALVTRMNNLGLRDRQDTKQHEFHNSTQFNHHPQQQQQQQQHLQHQQHRYQQYQPQQPHHHQGSQAHHHHNHHGHSQSMQQQQMHQLPFGGSYGTSYSNAIHNQMNHPMFLAGGGNGGDNRKHNAAGGQHRSRQQQHHHHHQHHHHQQQQQHQHHHQQGPHHHHQSASSIGGGGGSGGMPMGGNGGGAEYVDDEQSSEHQSFALDYLTEVIAELYDNPGMFEDVKEKLSKMFSDFRNDRYVLSNAVEMIFEQSIKESNFRYMGARLCKLLDSLDENPESVLREMFQLKMEDQQNELKQMNHEQLKVRGTTLFLAELYMQFRNPHVQSTLTKDMAGRIFAAIEILLQKPGPENAKCVCQCLKLCGFELEQDCREDVLNILDKLRDLEKNVMHSVAPLISSVLKLHNNAWGRSEETVPVAPVPAVPDRMVGVMPLGADFSPVFYGPDGKVLSEEENSFLETNLHQAKKNAVFDDYEDDEDAYGVDDQDPEVQLAFENFVAETNRPNRQQHHH